MPQAQEGNRVRVHYTGKLNDGTIFDSSEGRDPLEFILGGGMVIPGFDDAITGLELGESITAIIPAEKAYGPRNDEMIIVVEKSQFPAHLNPRIGDKYQIPQENGQIAMLTVTDISDEAITLDANHELAGKDLTFDITLVEIL